MKKMKKIAATILCLGMAISTLCACSSTESTKPSTEDPKPTEAVTTAEPTVTEEPAVESITESSVTDEPTTAASTANDISPLWHFDEEEQVRQVDPESWFTDFNNTTFIYIPLLTTDRKIGESTLFQLADPYFNARTFVLKRDPEDVDGTSVEIYFLAGPDNSGAISIEINGESNVVSFMPLFYNQSKGCLAGYMRYSEGDVRFVELYWSSVLGKYMAYDDTFDPSLYGF